MSSIFKISGSTLENARKLLLKAYGVRANEYDILEGAAGGDIVISINVAERTVETAVYVRTDEGDFKGYLNFFPPLNTDRFLSYDEVTDLLEAEKISMNVKYDLIKDAHTRYLNGEIITDLLISEGVVAIDGRDSELILHFDQVLKKPKITADGKVDYKSVDNFITAKKGEVLLTKKSATPGVRGVNIMHEDVIPKAGNEIELIAGEGVCINDTGSIFTATNDGFIDFDGRKISVYPVYVVENNVDYGTGNIRFNGTVHIKGDVLSGFKVESDKHIFVDGICQDCELIAKGNVVLRTGIKSTGVGYIKAGATAIIGYGEKAKVHAKENIIIQKYAYNCELFAGNKVEATGGDGIIAGGIVRAFSEVVVKQLGTQGNTKFSVMVGTRFYVEEDLSRLRKEKLRMAETIEQINFALSRFDLTNQNIASHPKVKKMLELKLSFNNLIKELDEREYRLISMNKANNPKIKVKNMIFEGVSVVFINKTSTVREPMSNVVFYYDEKYNEVAWVSMKDAASIEPNEPK